MLFLDYPKVIVSIHTHDNTLLDRDGDDVILYRPYNTSTSDALLIDWLFSPSSSSDLLLNQNLQIKKTKCSQEVGLCGTYTIDNLVKFREPLPVNNVDGV
jgi:hypothetical protein